MLHPVVDKPIIEPTICRDGSVDYTCSNMVNPLVSFDQVREFYDMQAKSLRTTLDEIYNSISKINADIEKFNSDVNRTQESYILLQRTVNSQLDNMSHQIKNAQQQSVLQLTAFSDRLDYFEGQIDAIRNLINENKATSDKFLNTVQSRLNDMNEQMRNMESEMEMIRQDIANAKSDIDVNKECITALREYSLPKIEDMINSVNNCINTALDDEVNRATGAEKELSDRIDSIENETGSTGSELRDMITREILRAKQQEIAIIDSVKKNQTEDDNRYSELTHKINDVNESIASVDEKVAAEKDRATQSEDTIKQLISQETNRAVAAENGIKIDLNTVEGRLSSDINSAVNEINEERDARVKDINKLTTRIDEIDQSIGEIVESSIVIVENQFNERIDSEKNERLAADKKLSDEIAKNLELVSGRIAHIKTDLESEVVRSTTADNNTKASIDDINVNIESLEKRLTAVEKIVSSSKSDIDYLKKRSDQFDQLIREKIDQSTAALFARLESLDNRLDAEINHNRSAMRKLDHRISLLEGVPESDCEGCDDEDIENNPFIDSKNPFID